MLSSNLVPHTATLPQPITQVSELMWYHGWFWFCWNRCFFDISTIASNIRDPTLCELIFFYMFIGCDIASSFFKLSKLGWWKVWKENNFITATFIKFRWTPNAAEEEDFISIKKPKFMESFQLSTLLWQRSLSNRNQSTSMGLFLFDRELRHERKK